jgi:hypothetical protein
MESAGQDKNSVTKQDTTSQDYTALAQQKEVIGKIASVDVKAGIMTFTIETSHQEPKDPQAVAIFTQKQATQQQQLALDYQKYLNAKSVTAQQQALVRYQKLQAQIQQSNANAQNLFKTVTTGKDYDLEIMDSLKVARRQLAEKYDDMGELIKYKAEDLEKLKSKDIPSGYIATSDDLQVGQTVKLYISPPKKDKKTTDSSSSGGSTQSTSGDADTKKTDPPPNRPRVRMALIVEEAPPPPDTSKKKKKNDR